jgi:Uma2 family endonuclease
MAVIVFRGEQEGDFLIILALREARGNIWREPMTTLLRIGPADHGRPVTVEEFESAQDEEGYSSELIDGRWYVSPDPELPHDRILDWVLTVLKEYAGQHPEVINYISSHARVPVSGRSRPSQAQPDVTAYHDFPLHLPIRSLKWRDVSPVLVVEVVSEDNSEKDLVRNVEIYEYVPSIREYWILDPLEDPDHPPLKVNRKRGRTWQRPIDVPAGSVSTTKLLPGLELLVDPRGE